MTHSSSSVDLEITPCGRGADSYACSGCDCGLETRQVRRLRLEVARLKAQLADEQANANMHRQLAAIVARDLQEARQIVAIQRQLFIAQYKTIESLRAQLAAQTEELKDAAAYIAKQDAESELETAVVEAAREHVEAAHQHGHVHMPLIVALARLDAADVRAASAAE